MSQVATLVLSQAAYAVSEDSGSVSVQVLVQDGIELEMDVIVVVQTSNNSAFGRSQ